MQGTSVWTSSSQPETNLKSGQAFSRSCGGLAQYVLCFSYLFRPHGWIICDLLILIFNMSLLSSHAIICFRAAVSKKTCKSMSHFLFMFCHQTHQDINKGTYFPKATLSSKKSLCDAKKCMWDQQTRCWAVCLSLNHGAVRREKEIPPSGLGIHQPWSSAYETTRSYKVTQG